MTTDIFIKTYIDDLKWLPWLFKSIDKYATGFRQIIITCDEPEIDVLRLMPMPTSMPVTILTSHKFQGVEGYIQQQYVKMNAHLHTDADLILFVDSDCMFTKPVTPEYYMRNDMPIILKTDYSKVGDAIVWKELTQRYTGFEVEYEYMRRMPLMYWNNTLKRMHSWKPELNSEILSVKGRHLSEFNILGAYCDFVENGYYSFINTDDEIPDAKMRQFWSWGNITKEVKDEMQKILND